MKKLFTTISDKTMREIDKLIIDQEGVYSSRSHFVRCGIIRQLREHTKKVQE